MRYSPSAPLVALATSVSPPRRHSWVWLTASLLVACGGEEPAATGAPAAPLAPAAPAPAPTAAEAPAAPAAEAAPAAPAGPPTSCHLEPAGGTVVIANRRAPLVMVGAEHAVILHEARRPPARCQGAPLATVIPVPVPAALPVPSTPPECFPEEEDTTGRIAQTGRLERIGDVPVFLGCSCDPDPVNGCACGVTAPPGAFGGRSFYMGGSHTTTGGLGVDLAVNGDVAYMAADVDDTGNGRIAFLGHRINLAAPAEDRPRWRQIAPEPSAAVRHGLRIEIVENLPDRTVILYGSANAPRATRVVMGADGLREGAAETVDWPVVPPPVASVISDRERGAPPFVRLVTSDAMRPITGVNDAVGAFSPALIEVDGAHVLFWSEDLGDRTRIWGAILNIATAEIGARFPVTAGDVESGNVHADVFGGHAVVTWAQREGEGHAVRAANLVCSR